MLLFKYGSLQPLLTRQFNSKNKTGFFLENTATRRTMWFYPARFSPLAVENK